MRGFLPGMTLGFGGSGGLEDEVAPVAGSKLWAAAVSDICGCTIVGLDGWPDILSAGKHGDGGRLGLFVIWPSAVLEGAGRGDASCILESKVPAAALMDPVFSLREVAGILGRLFVLASELTVGAISVEDVLDLTRLPAGLACALAPDP